MLILIFLISSSFAATIIPFERDAPRKEKYAFLRSTNDLSLNYTSTYGVDENDQLYWEGSTIKNYGPNNIVPDYQGEDFASREYYFTSDDHAIRDTHLWITDYNGSSWMSDMFETVLVFLPRLNQMQVEEVGDKLVVTLTTGEEILFSAKERTIKSGVLVEAPMDMNPDRNLRNFADISYNGKGIILRSDAKAADPRLSPTIQVLKQGQKPCVLPSETFWTQTGYPKFKFIRDEEAFAVIKQKCGMKYLP
jgi:hypothetical protein